jgi:hypothetical protein
MKKAEKNEPAGLKSGLGPERPVTGTSSISAAQQFVCTLTWHTALRSRPRGTFTWYNILQSENWIETRNLKVALKVELKVELNFQLLHVWYLAGADFVSKWPLSFLVVCASYSFIFLFIGEYKNATILQ